MGIANDAGTLGTSIKTTTSGTALVMNNNGIGSGSYMLSTGGTGLIAETSSAAKYGVQANNLAAAGGAGAAILANGIQNTGLVGQTSAAGKYGVSARNLAAAGGSGAAIFADGRQQDGLQATTANPSGAGVWGSSTSASGSTFGVYGDAASPDGWGVYSAGDMGTNSNLYVTGSITKGGGSFKIDHPLDPANKFLYHSFMESPDMKNVYDGVVALDQNGEATVELPAWFEALNRDVRYQLTAIGTSGPDLHIKSEVKGNRFTMAGGKAGQKVSWQLTGIRQDAWAEAHRIPVEVAKTGKEKGRYLHPKEHGKADAKGIAKLHEKRLKRPTR